ncbi:MAG TPA: alpha/beta fold hydrolase, partial [Propionibacteriaceae bacterium]
MKKAAAVGGGLALVLAGMAAPSPASGIPSTTLAPAPASSGYTPRPLVWGACESPTLQSFGSQCANLVVPLDYARPNGRTITLAVSRLKHTSPDADYQGVMLANPGGPGASGLTLSIFGQGSFIPGDGDLTYDWIGFDPRGVGSSTPALSCDPSFFGYDRPNYTPRTRALEKVWLQRSEGYAKACRRSDAAALLPHMKTTDNVADMESLRKALGESQINYYGFSYGTYLGQVYASLHPNRVRRFVWDGVVNPARAWYAANLDQDKAFQKTI